MQLLLLFGLIFSVAKVLKRLEELCTFLLFFFKRKTHSATMNMLKEVTVHSPLLQSPAFPMQWRKKAAHVATGSVQAAVRRLLIPFPTWQAFSLFK